jgi:hypothetical protein
MANLYSNIPPNNAAESSSDNTVKFFNQYYVQPLDVDNNSLLLMQAFFEKRGFAKSSAEFTSSIILSQATLDGYNPIAILDTLKGLSDAEISGIVSEILNHNRFKTSALGMYFGYVSPDEIQRNIVA